MPRTNTELHGNKIEQKGSGLFFSTYHHLFLVQTHCRKRDLTPFVLLAAGASPVSNPLLLEIARPAREKKKLVPELTKRLIQRLCQNEPLTAEQLGESLDRRKEKLQENFLAQMVANGELQLRYPDQLTHPEQAYRTNPNWSKS